MDDANRALGPARPTVSSAKDKQVQAPLPPNSSDAFASSLEGRAFGNHN
jgi:hypothetical protein